LIRPRSIERSLRFLLLAAGDALIAIGCLALSVFVRRNIDFEMTRSLLPPEKFPLDIANVLLPAFSLLLALGLSGFYNSRVSHRHRPLLITALVIQMALVALGATLLTRPYPRTILVAVPLLEALSLPLWRRLLKVLMPVRPRETVIIGSGDEIRAFVTALHQFPDSRIELVGVISPEAVPEVNVAWKGWLGSSAAEAVVREAEELIYVSRDENPESRLHLLEMRGAHGFLLMPSQADALITSGAFGWVGDQPLVEIGARCGYGIWAVVKRTMDIAGGIVMLLISLPLWILITAAILIDDGRPVLLRQRRAGRNGIEFLMWKFRTMRTRVGEADDLRLALLNDDRVTPSGLWLRRHRLDEIPQLINVIAGEMSLVGPRPERPEIVAEVSRSVPAFGLRLIVRPGLAGLAQVWAEYDTDPAIKLRYDLTYICAWSLGLDLRILLRAVSTALSGRGM